MDFMKRMLDPDIKLRRRMIQLLSTIALAEFIIVSIYTVVTGGDFAHIAIMLAGTAAFAATVAITFRTGHIRAGAAISGLLYFLLYPLTFFQSAGMYGGAPVTFTFALIYVFLVTQKWERVVLLASCIAMTAGCYTVAYLHPEMLSKHTVLTEHIESFLAIMLVVLLVCSLFKFVTDVYITENRIVQRQKKEIEDLNNAQKRFFSSMSHEIRTPVNAVIGLNEMNMHEDVPDEVLENSKNIEVAGKILLQTINEIMDMSRLETGTMEIMTADYRTTEMLSDIVGMTWLRAKEKGLDFKIDVDPEVPSRLNGDEVRIKQILLNVVTNAVKYTPEGSVKLSISGHPGSSKTSGADLPDTRSDTGSDAAAESAERQDKAQVQENGAAYIMEYDVTDTGIGIREENIPYLFTSFQRVDDQKTHAIEGTGLGLSIVKQLLDLMGGTVTVTSEYGKGSNFHIEIPQTVVDGTPVGPFDMQNREDRNGASSEAEAGKASKDEKASGNDASGQASDRVSGMNGSDKNGQGSAGKQPAQDDRFAGLDIRALAVDDTPMNLMVIKKFLRDTGIKLDTAESGKKALQLTAENHYDVILMDHQMPEMDGIECLKQIRSQDGGKCRDSKAVCLTANVGADMQKLYMESGFDGYMEKPVRGARLKDLIAELT